MRNQNAPRPSDVVRMNIYCIIVFIIRQCRHHAIEARSVNNVMKNTHTHMSQQKEALDAFRFFLKKERMAERAARNAQGFSKKNSERESAQCVPFVASD